MAKFNVRSASQGLALIRHPDIVKNFERALRWRPRNKKAVLVPCAGTKPFFEAPSHRDGYLEALGEKDVDLWVVSEPLGVVPYDWSDRYPQASYDFPPRFLRGQAWVELAQRIARWLETVAPKYESVYVALPAHHTRLLAGALMIHDPGNVVDASHGKCLASGACPTGHGRATSTKYRAFLKRKVANPSDEELRALERAARSGDQDAYERWLIELSRRDAVMHRVVDHRAMRSRPTRWTAASDFEVDLVDFEDQAMNLQQPGFRPYWVDSAVQNWLDRDGRTFYIKGVPVAAWEYFFTRFDPERPWIRSVEDFDDGPVYYTLEAVGPVNLYRLLGELQHPDLPAGFFEDEALFRRISIDVVRAVMES